jgi:hypothetical protein
VQIERLLAWVKVKDEEENRCQTRCIMASYPLYISPRLSAHPYQFKGRPDLKQRMLISSPVCTVDCCFHVRRRASAGIRQKAIRRQLYSSCLVCPGQPSTARFNKHKSIECQYDGGGGSCCRFCSCQEELDSLRHRHPRIWSPQKNSHSLGGGQETFTCVARAHIWLLTSPGEVVKLSWWQFQPLKLLVHKVGHRASVCQEAHRIRVRVRE